MPSSDEKDEQEELLNDDWEPKAWVYFIWLVLGNRLYCKIGQSVDPISRYQQLVAGMPEQPYAIQLLSCLCAEQAKLFERMLHDHFQFYRTRGEWFSHANAKHFYGVLQDKLEEIYTLFFTFGYQPEFETIELDGDRPVLYHNGFISHVTADNAIDGE